MRPNFAVLDDCLKYHGIDGYLLDAASDTPNQLYLSGFVAHDPFITLYTSGEIYLLLAGMEATRAKKESHATGISKNEHYGGRGRIRHFGKPGNRSVLASFLSEHNVDSLLVPNRFPVGTADGLRAADIPVTVAETDPLLDSRAVKTFEEINHIARTQESNLQAMDRVETILSKSSVEDGVLQHEGQPLTSERLKTKIEIQLLNARCELDDAIVACGSNAADPHDTGSGPLKPNETIIVDIFPRNKDSRYYGDLTRTFVVGEPSDAVRRFYHYTENALNAALETLEAGVEAAAVHDAACDVYESAGYQTLRTDPEADTGFIHRTGHGIGLAIHEKPRLSHKGPTLQAGNVVTVEPGLYDPEVGGVRIEDLVVITEDGYENLTDYHRNLVV